MQAVIMAGGKGTRIASLVSDVPKPMILICGKPILQYQIECLKAQGIKEIILVIGHLGNVIKSYFGEGEKYGVSITYIEETVPLGTAGALYYLKDKIKDDFLLLNGDIIFDIDVKRFMAYHKKMGGEATIFTHPNSHPYDSGIVITDQHGVVKRWLNKEDDRKWYKNRVNAGLHILSPHIFDLVMSAEKMDLDRDVLKKLIPERKLVAYDSPEYVKDMGTPERFEAVTRDIETGLVQAKNLTHRQKAVFLDRDGTVNIYKGFIRRAEDFELIPGVAKAIKKVNESGYLAIIVTNQPVIARGECSFEELERIHQKMETLLGQEGAYIDDIFCCPHHPNKGYAGERIEYKIDCDCRKPKPGLLYQAAQKYNIDLEKSYMVGDDERDMEAGRRAGCRLCKIDKNDVFDLEL